MTKTMQSQAQKKQNEPPHLASFVLRCWKDSSSQVRARLVDIQSGISYPLADLDELPDLVRRLTARTLPDSASTDTLPADELRDS